MEHDVTINSFPAHRLVSRREMLALCAGLGAAAALRMGPARATDASPLTAPLLTRPIPRTGERLPVIGLGTAIVFDIADDAVRRAERRAVIRTMVEGGARLIDTAPSYGTAESVVGDLVSELKVRDRLFLATKVRVAGRDASIAEFEQSLRRLRTDRLDLMQLHNVGADARETAAQISLLREWKDRGVFRYIGVTHSVASTNERVIGVMQREKPDFVQVNYSMAERGVEERLLAVAAETGAAVLVNLPFGRGRLFNAVRGRQVPEWAAEFDATTWGQFFLKYILAEQAVTAVIPGTDKAQYMLDNLNAGRGRLPDAAMRRKMIAFWESVAG
jgi:aryl-alcohol dehydrogenase-like predicted oxidoreductase